MCRANNNYAARRLYFIVIAMPFVKLMCQAHNSLHISAGLIIYKYYILFRVTLDMYTQRKTLSPKNVIFILLYRMS